MNTLCWGDAERTLKLKQRLQEPMEYQVNTLNLYKNESDTLSGCRTSCSSYDISDDDDCSDDCSISSTDSKILSPLNIKRKEPLHIAFEHKTIQGHGVKTFPFKHKVKDQENSSKILRCVPHGLRRVIPIVVPIELIPPSEYDLRSTNGLMKCVNNLAPLPTPEQLSGKHLAFNELQRIVDIWLRRTLLTLSENDVNSVVTATLLLGGSWHLKVGVAESDLDVVALMPYVITPDVFFTSMCEHLNHEESVTNLVARRQAAIPVLSFQLNGVRIDLLFARFAQNQTVPKHLPFLPGDDVEMMRDMDATSVRSLSVARVASLILELAPNAIVFRSCLRVVRLWAKRRGVYSNKTGFLGGISWALLVCFVCQMFPRASVASLVHRFFSVLAKWQWPTPILVAHTSVEGTFDRTVQWNPQLNIRDRAHLMPIITPGFPAVNTAVNVNLSTLCVLREEFARGQRIMDDLRRRSLSHPSSWTQLFAPTEVLVRYDNYVAIKLGAPNEATLAEWSSFVASRTRKLVESLQYTTSVASLHPLPDLIRPHHETHQKDQVMGYYFIGYTVNAPLIPQRYRNDRRFAGRAFMSKFELEQVAQKSVASASRYFLATEVASANEKKPGMEIDISCCLWNELPETIFPGGRTAAIGDRAQYFLRHAHDVNLTLGLAR
ncbi:putative nucleotidyltransferase, class I-like, poly(A) polymerase [Plasmopara halstedii]